MGLDWVRQHYEPPAVVVMALGGESQYALDMAVRNIALSGLPVVVAAGNEDTDACSKSPARWTNSLLQQPQLAILCSGQAWVLPGLFCPILAALRAKLRPRPSCCQSRDTAIGPSHQRACTVLS